MRSASRRSATARTATFGAWIALAAALAVSTVGSTAAASTPASSPAAKKYTMAQVRQHNKPADCWSVVSGGVYNLTSWINRHPGGSGVIIRMCGKDGTSAFNSMHRGARRPESTLRSYKIGVLG